MIIEDGTYTMANLLAEDHNPYAYVVRALRQTLKECLEAPKGDNTCLINFMGDLSLSLCCYFCNWSYRAV